MDGPVGIFCQSLHDAEDPIDHRRGHDDELGHPIEELHDLSPRVVGVSQVGDFSSLRVVHVHGEGIPHAGRGGDAVGVQGRDDGLRLDVSTSQLVHDGVRSAVRIDDVLIERCENDERGCDSHCCPSIVRSDVLRFLMKLVAY